MEFHIRLKDMEMVSIQRLRCVIFLVMNVMLLVAPALCDESPQADNLCRKIEMTMNALVDSARTTCMPISVHKAVSFLLISGKPIFSEKSATRKEWLIATVGAVANAMTAHTTIKNADVFVSDRNMMKERRGYRYPIALAKTLQQQTRAHQMGLEELYQQLSGALVPTPIPSKVR